MPHSNFDEILTFIAVVKAGSFVNGGRACGLTRSAAGKSVARLESHLGTRLLNRTTRNLSLTDDGRIFYERSIQILNLIEEAEASVGEHKGIPQGILRITLPEAFGRLEMLPLMRDYLETWPDVQIEATFSDRVLDIVEEGFDLSIRIGISTNEPDQDSRLISRVVARHKAIIAASPEYIKKRGEPKSPDDIINHDCLIFSSRMKSHIWRVRGGDEEWINIGGRGRVRFDNGDALRDATLAGLGIVCLPSFLIGTDIENGRLIPLLPGYETESVPIIATYASRLFLPSKTRCFIDLMIERWENTL